MPRTRGYMVKVLQLLSEKCCVSYAELAKAGVSKNRAWHYAIKLERREIAKRVHSRDGRTLICLKMCSDHQQSL